VGLKVVADDFFVIGDYDVAAYKYMQATSFLGHVLIYCFRCMTNPTQVLEKLPKTVDPDEAFTTALLHVEILCTINNVTSVLYRQTNM